MTKKKDIALTYILVRMYQYIWYFGRIHNHNFHSNSKFWVQGESIYFSQKCVSVAIHFGTALISQFTVFWKFLTQIPTKSDVIQPFNFRDINLILDLTTLDITSIQRHLRILKILSFWNVPLPYSSLNY